MLLKSVRTGYEYRTPIIMLIYTWYDIAVLL